MAGRRPSFNEGHEIDVQLTRDIIHSIKEDMREAGLKFVKVVIRSESRFDYVEYIPNHETYSRPYFMVQISDGSIVMVQGPNPDLKEQSVFATTCLEQDSSYIPHLNKVQLLDYLKSLS